MKIVIATRNKAKAREIQEILEDLTLEILTLDDFPEIPNTVENGKTFKENALKKARFIAQQLNMPTLADDSGLEVEILDKQPGIYSARYAGENATDEENNSKLLAELKDIPLEKRKACYRCVIAIALPSGTEETVEGDCCGIIVLKPRGVGGFGYDHIFYVPEYGKTMAELSSDIKNRISHRGKALAKLKKKLLSKNSNLFLDLEKSCKDSI